MNVSRLMAALALAAALISTSSFAQENPVQIQNGNEYGIVNVADYVALLPDESDKVIEGQTIVRRPDAGVRAFRLPRNTRTRVGLKVRSSANATASWLRLFAVQRANTRVRQYRRLNLRTSMMCCFLPVD